MQHVGDGTKINCTWIYSTYTTIQIHQVSRNTFPPLYACCLHKSSLFLSETDLIFELIQLFCKYLIYHETLKRSFHYNVQKHPSVWRFDAGVLHHLSSSPCFYQPPDTMNQTFGPCSVPARWKDTRKTQHSLWKMTTCRLGPRVH